MKRRHFNLAGALSLMVFLVTAGLWVRSYIRGDTLQLHTARGNRYSAISASGILLFERHENVIYHPTEPRPALGFTYIWRERPTNFWQSVWRTDRQWRLAGFGLIINGGTIRPDQKSARPGTWQGVLVLVPHWAVVLIATILVGVWLRALLCHRHRARSALCPTCGYDLRATPERCPECGAVPAVK